MEASKISSGELSKDLDNNIKAHLSLRENLKEIEEIGNEIVHAFLSGKKLLICGNGGSAADAQHIAAELVGRFKMERAAMPAIALSTDTSIITAVGNDYGFDSVFSRQVEALGNKGDILIAISTSGNSKNVINAVQTARKKGIFTIALLGNDGGKIKKIANRKLIINSNDTARIQEAHMFIYHSLCSVIEQSYKRKKDELER